MGCGPDRRGSLAAVEPTRGRAQAPLPRRSPGLPLIQGRREVDLLFPAVDYAGFVLEWDGVTRHIQLKASHSRGKRDKVTINYHLASKPGGCVIWMLFDEKTLKLERFLWFGEKPGQVLPDLGTKIGRHTKADQELVKAPERANTRVVPRSRFRRLDTSEEVAEALFGSLKGVAAPAGDGKQATKLSF